MEFTLRHCDHPSRLATYGVDPERGGAYLDVAFDGAVIAWDDAELRADHDDPTLGVLSVLAMWGFVSGADVDDALAWLTVSRGENFATEPPPGWPLRRRPRRGVRRVLRVIEELEMEGR